MASRSLDPPAEESATKYLPPTLASLTESLSLLGVDPETMAISMGESLAERYLASLRQRALERVERPVERVERLVERVERPVEHNVERPMERLGGGCGVPRYSPIDEPILQLFSNDFMEYLNQIA